SARSKATSRYPSRRTALAKRRRRVRGSWPASSPAATGASASLATRGRGRECSMVPEGRYESRLGWFLSVVAGSAAVLALLVIGVPIFRPDLAFAAESPGLAGAVSALGLIAGLAWFGAADVRRF